MNAPRPTHTPVTIYYDGSCRICCAQRDRFVRLDRDSDRLAFVDIADPAFDPATIGTTRDALLARIHAAPHGIPDDQPVAGMAALRLAYAALGRGRLLAVTGWPIVRPIANALYAVLARNRHRFGRIGRSACDTDTCRPNEPQASAPGRVQPEASVPHAGCGNRSPARSTPHPP